jgi:hypothetical protein
VNRKNKANKIPEKMENADSGKFRLRFKTSLLPHLGLVEITMTHKCKENAATAKISSRETVIK